MADAAVTVWRVMGNTIDWTALPILCDVLGVTDPELLIQQLLTIRESLKHVE